MKVALYSGLSAVSRLIRWQTRSCYSHAALLLDGGAVIESWHRGGCDLHPHLGTVHTPGTPVDIFSVEGLDAAAAARARNYAEMHLGDRYDWMGVVRFVSRRPHRPSGRVFCSSLVAGALLSAGVPLLLRAPAHHLSPRDISLSPRLTHLRTVLTTA